MAIAAAATVITKPPIITMGIAKPALRLEAVSKLRKKRVFIMNLQP
ncbi:hypothetical protein D082_02320 [Synechocystis sp. PCC 6714]|nr:hypothetical protein D082_02320 [Synechocystis sp. PCC 6714]